MERVEPLRIGVYIPSHNNPLYLRLALLQMEAQTRVPDVIAVFENNHAKSYWWAVEDVVKRLTDKGVEIIHAVGEQRRYREPEVHYVPLEQLYQAGCDVFFKIDHDDFYYAHYIQTGIEELEGYDFVINETAHMLTLAFDAPYEFQFCSSFTMNPLGGMSNASCFNRAFALKYLKEMKAVTLCEPDDWVMFECTKHFNFKVKNYKRKPTTCYVRHGENSSASHHSLRRWILHNVQLVKKWLDEGS